MIVTAIFVKSPIEVIECNDVAQCDRQMPHSKRFLHAEVSTVKYMPSPSGLLHEGVDKHFVSVLIVPVELPQEQLWSRNRLQVLLLRRHHLS
ncbi:hypothetical protein NPIL_673371 [Nephila pilipes]|uniref:Uncharacterized protein n=1 Tax=Nephila pilipes TaxID=299642 RepID=A0A8X6NKK8_NEPPI|nr:hypothetical protein NPIL_673371 [Nephila pilipes]